MITAIILTKNEENNIERCIESLSFCDEIIVVDDNSTDSTKSRAILKDVKVVDHALDGDFSQQRNFGLGIAENDWVLFVDADEVVSYKLGQEIKNTVMDHGVIGYYIKREDTIFGKTLKHGELRNKKFVRLAQKNAGNWKGEVHEEWMVKGKTKTLSETLTHYPHQTFAQFINEINFYTTLRAQELHTQGVKSNMLTIIFYTKAKFIQTYIIKMGFLDGMPGLVYSVCMSLHSFLVRSKLYLLQKRKL